MLPPGHDGTHTFWASLSELCFLLAQEAAQVKKKGVKETLAKRPEALGESSTELAGGACHCAVSNWE